MLGGRAVYFGVNQGIAFVDLGRSDYKVSVDRRNAGAADGGNTGLVFRYQNSGNFWALTTSGATPSTQQVALSLWVNGQYPSVAFYANLPANWTTLAADVRGDQIKILVDGAQVIATTNATHNTATRAGLYAQTGLNVPRWNNFTVLP